MTDTPVTPTDMPPPAVSVVLPAVAVTEFPVTVTVTPAPSPIVTLPTAEVPATPEAVTVTPEPSTTVTDPTEPVSPVNATSLGNAIPALKGNINVSHVQAILIIALLESAVGKVMVKSPLDEDLSEPKFSTRTALFADPPVVEEL